MFLFVLSSFHEIFREAPEEQHSMQTPTPFHDPTPTPVSLVFFDLPRAQAKRNVRRYRDPDYAYLFMSRTVMAALEYYSGTWADEISRQQTRKVRAPPHGVDLDAYSGIKEEIVVVTVQADAMFVHG